MTMHEALVQAAKVNGSAAKDSSGGWIVVPPTDAAQALRNKRDTECHASQRNWRRHPHLPF